jgi:PIN domain nuclease of toxin-antitoxin system
MGPANAGTTMATLLDTHAWVWWVTEDARLSRRAAAAIRRGVADDQLFVSLISAWEIAKKVEKGQLHLDRPVNQWLDQALMPSGLGIWELTRPILVESCGLPQPFHGDPADRIIVATARRHGAVIVTKDEKIRGYPHVRSLWYRVRASVHRVA